jgi:hypothetical protein
MVQNMADYGAAAGAAPQVEYYDEMQAHQFGQAGFGGVMPNSFTGFGSWPGMPPQGGQRSVAFPFYLLSHI